MNYILIGNVIALVASVLMVYTGFLKNKKQIICIQTIQIGLATVSNIVLGGITGAIINTICCIRNILCYKGKLDVKYKIIITILSVVLSCMFNDLGIIGLFPLIATVPYLWLMNIKGICKFKFLLMYSSTIWIIYEICIKSYSSAMFNLANVIANIISIIQIKFIKNKSVL